MWSFYESRHLYVLGVWHDFFVMILENMQRELNK